MTQLNPSQYAIPPGEPPGGRHKFAVDKGFGRFGSAGLSLALLSLMGCSPPDPAGPLLVYPADLARSYAHDPATANRAYTGQVVCLPLRGFRHAGDTLTWALADDSTSPPVLILEFTGPVPEPSPAVWIEGRVAGRESDSIPRELPRYDFTVRLTDCRTVPRPTRLP